MASEFESAGEDLGAALEACERALAQVVSPEAFERATRAGGPDAVCRRADAAVGELLDALSRAADAASIAAGDDGEEGWCGGLARESDAAQRVLDEAGPILWRVRGMLRTWRFGEPPSPLLVECATAALSALRASAPGRAAPF